MDFYLLQAIYNVLVTALFILLACAVYYVVLVVLEPFLVPLFWAVLTGFVIHPYKAKFTQSLRDWLQNLNDEHDKPAVIAIVTDLVHLIDWIFVSIGSKFLSKWKFMILLAIALPIYHYVTFYPLDVTTPSIISHLSKALSIMELVTWPLVASCVLTYGISVLILWQEERKNVFNVMGTCVWTLIAIYSLNQVWPPIWILALAGLIFYALTKLCKSSKDETDSDSKSKRMRFREAVLTVLNRINSTQHLLDVTTDSRSYHPSAVSTPAPTNANIGQQERIEKIQHPGVSALKKTHLRNVLPNSPIPMGETPKLSRHYRTQILKRSSKIELGTSQETSSYIKTVFWACICIQLFVHPTLLHLLPIPIIYALLKKVLTIISQYLTDFLKLNDFWAKRKSAFLPHPVELSMRELYKMERAVLKNLPKFLDTIVTGLVIFAMIVGVVLALVFISAQMYSETLYIVQTSGKVVSSVTNSSLFQQMNDSLGLVTANNSNYFKGIEDVIDTGYRYGREYISSSVVSIFKSEVNNESVDEFEKKLLELWDRIYQYYLTKNDQKDNDQLQSSSQIQFFGPNISQEALTSSVEEVVQKVMAILDLSAFSQFTMNNMGTIISIIDHGWSLLKGNLGFALTVLTEMLRIIFHSGSGMVNFLLSIIVYFTALFYLLSSDSKSYKPVEIISNLSGMFIGSGFANALNKAINSVFTVTFKMASFYGLWTYLTHVVFNASVITVPVLVSTFLAAVPVAGQYLVALPAVMELWLIKERPISALALLTGHILPTYVVDAALYSELKQGIHPWITGLSIVGGVYYFGIFGAIYGPLFLCGMYVILSVYMGWLQDIPLDPTGPAGHPGVSRTKTMMTPTPVLKRSESVQHY